jgi:hypothetical protein
MRSILPPHNIDYSQLQKAELSRVSTLKVNISQHEDRKYGNNVNYA